MDLEQEKSWRMQAVKPLPSPASKPPNDVGSPPTKGAEIEKTYHCAAFRTYGTRHFNGNDSHLQKHKM